MKLEESMTLTARSITALSVDLPMNYFDKYFKLEKQRQALWHCGVQFKCFKKLGTQWDGSTEMQTFFWDVFIEHCNVGRDFRFSLGQNEMSLRLAYYPPFEKGSEPLPGQLRYGEHTDYTGSACDRCGTVNRCDHGDHMSKQPLPQYKGLNQKWMLKRGGVKAPTKIVFMMCSQHLGFGTTCCKGFTLLWQDHNTNGPNPRENAATEQLGESRV